MRSGYAEPVTTAPRTRGRPPSGGREEILRATLELLREKGVARLTTREVAERAGVSEGSIFYNFTDRPGLLIATFQHTLGPLHVAEPTAADGDLRSVLLGWAEQIERFLESGLVVLMAAQSDTELRERIGEFMRDNDYGPQRGIAAIGGYLAQLQVAGAVRSDVDPQVIATMLINNAFQRAALPTLVGHSRGVVSLSAFVDTLVTLIAAPTI
jgi:AcrR family transcriptional regulator